MAAGWLAAGRANLVQGGRETGQALSALEDLEACCLPVAPILATSCIVSFPAAGENSRPRNGRQ